MAQSQPTMVFTSKRLQPSSRSCPLLKRVVAIAISLCFTRYLFISGFFPVVQAWGVPPSHNRPNGVDLSLTRRVWLKGSLMAMLSSPYVGLLHPVPSAAAVASSIPLGYADISERLTANRLQQIPSSQAFNSGIDNTPYPDWLNGTWRLTQTLVSVDTPLGLSYAGGPNGVEAIAEKSIAESRSQLGLPVELQVRFITSNSMVVEDRLYNTQQRLDAFAGRSVVAQVAYADTRASNRAAFQAVTQRMDDPLETTYIRFKGPAAQKTFVAAHHRNVEPGFTDSTEKGTTRWVGFECQRSLFALTNQSTAPPITTDTEFVFSYNKISDDHIQGKLRIVGYLNPNDKLYFQALNRAVTIQDYELDLTRVAPTA